MNIIAIPLLLTYLICFAGWVTNAIWTFQNADHTSSLLLGILGAIVAPLGAAHGIYLWF